MTFLQQYSITKRAAIVFASMLTLAAVLLFILHNFYMDEFSKKHESLSEHSARTSISEFNILLGEIRRSTRLFVANHSDLLWEMSQNPNDEHIFNRIEAQLLQHFPEHYSFTLTNLQGNLLYDDFGENIGDLCLRNIQENIEDEHEHGIVVHPGPGVYHIDIMVPWYFSGEKRGVFFKSYKLGHIARILKATQPQEHQLFIVRSDDPDLIEISAEGGRDEFGADRPVRLSQQEKANIIISKPIPDTEWTVIDVIDPDVYSDYQKKIIIPMTAAWLTGLLLSLIALYYIRNEENRRSEAEKALQQSNESLEVKVEERTRELQIFARAAEQSHDIVFITSRQGTIEYVNPRFEMCTGYAEKEVLGKNPSILKSSLLKNDFYADLWNTIESKHSFTAIFSNRHKDGHIIYMDQTITPLLNDNGEIKNYISTSHDVTEDKHNKEKLLYLSERDLLTGLYNSSYIEQYINDIVDRKDTGNTHFALYRIAISGIDIIYQAYGHTSNEQLQLKFAKRLMSFADIDNIISKLGKYEFLIYRAQVKDEAELNHYADELIKTLGRPIQIEDNNISFSCNIGIVIYPEDDITFDGLVKHAYTAVKQCEKTPGNSYSFYKSGMSALALERVQLEQRLLQALAHRTFDFYYQPKVNIFTGELTGFESLARWPQNENNKVISPAAFIPVLEDIGEIDRLCQIGINRACEFFSNSLPNYKNQFRIAINLSAQQFSDNGIVKCIQSALDKYQLPASCLEFEITESILIQNIDMVVDILNSIRNLGCHLSLDDFGTGYSSMQYLKILPIDSVKIDQGFIRNIEHNEEDRALTETIINMSHKLDKYVIAEGVESDAQIQLLRDMQCDVIQGYHVSRPIPENQLSDWLIQFNENTYIPRV